MLKILFLLPLFVALATICSAQNAQLLKLYSNKKIVTVKEGQSFSGLKKGSQQGLGSIKMEVEAVTQNNKVEKEISIIRDTKQKGWLVLLTANRLKISVESPSGKTVYDSDNVFERDPLAARFGSLYDEHIKKVVKINYNDQGEFSNKTIVNPSYSLFWKGRTPLFETKELWANGTVCTKLAELRIDKSTVWQDTLHEPSTNELFLMNYRIESIDETKVQVKCNGKSINKAQNEAKRTINKGSSIDGTMTVNTISFLIEKAEMNMTNEFETTLENNRITEQITSKYTVTNTLVDLKK